MISVYLIRPFYIQLGKVKRMTHLLQNSQLNLPGTEKPEKKVLKIEDSHIEMKYFKLEGLSKMPSNIPYRAVLKDTRGDHRFHIRETGFCSLISIYTFPDNTDPQKLREETRKAETHQKQLNVKHILMTIAKRLELERLKFEKTITFIHMEKDKKFIRTLASLYGVGKSFTAEEEINHLRLASKSLYIMSTQRSKKKSRRDMRWRIIQGIELGNGINSFISRGRSDFENMTLEKWRIVLNSWNPLLISGRITNISQIPSLSLVWFNRVSKIFDLRKRFRNLLVGYLSEMKSSAYQLLNIANALKEVKIYNSPIILPTIGEIDRNMSETEQEIYKIIRDQYIQSKQVIKYDENCTSPGLKLSEIVRRLDEKSGRKNNLVRGILDGLEEKRLITQETYSGPGRGKNKKIYSLRLKEHEFKSELAEFIKLKLPEDEDNIPIDIGWGANWDVM